MAGQADAIIENAAVQQQRQANETQQSGHATGNHGQQLLLRCGHKNLIQPVWRELPKQVAKEQEQDAAVKQVAPPLQLSFAQQL